MDFTDQEYTYCLWNLNMLPISYKLVFNDLLLLNNILIGCLHNYATDFSKISNGDPSTRSEACLSSEAC